MAPGPPGVSPHSSAKLGNVDFTYERLYHKVEQPPRPVSPIGYGGAAHRYHHQDHNAPDAGDGDDYVSGGGLAGAHQSQLSFQELLQATVDDSIRKCCAVKLCSCEQVGSGALCAHMFRCFGAWQMK